MSEFHAKKSPSQLPRLLGCPGSFLAAEYQAAEDLRQAKAELMMTMGMTEEQALETIEAMPEEQSSYAAEGTKLHDYMEQIFTRWNEPILEGECFTLDDITKDVLKDVEDDGHRVAVLDCVDYTKNLLATLGDEVTCGVEVRVYLDSYHEALDDTNGPADLYIFDISNNHLHVLDWKFGQGVVVYADNNDQAYAYGLGTIQMLERQEDEDLKLTVHIVQPRINHYDSEDVDWEARQHWLYKRCIPRLIIASLPDAPFVPGKKQCMWCPVRVCRPRMSEAQYHAKLAFGVKESLDKGMVDIKEIEAFLKSTRVLKDTMAKMEGYIADAVQQGNEDLGWKMVAGRANRAFVSARKVEAYLESKDLDPCEYYKTTLKGPAAIEKLSREIRDDPEFQALVYKPEGKPTLVPDSDRRPALVYKSPAQRFAEAMNEGEDT